VGGHAANQVRPVVAVLVAVDTAGLYVLVSGLIRVNWTVGEPYGRLKQSSHVQSEGTIHTTNAMQLHDYMTTGSTFGELALLTETPVAIDAVCETTALMYHIQYESVRTALDWVTDPPLDKRLWLIAAVRLSVPLLKALPAYYNLSLEEIKVGVFKQWRVTVWLAGWWGQSPGSPRVPGKENCTRG